MARTQTQVGHASLWYVGAEALAVLACTLILKAFGGRRQVVYPPATSQAIDRLWECIACEGTYTGKLYDLTRLGWETHHLADRSYVVVCPDCQGEYAERRRLRAIMES